MSCTPGKTPKFPHLLGLVFGGVLLASNSVLPAQAQTNPVSGDSTMTVAVEDVVILTVPASVTLTLSAQSSVNTASAANLTLSYDPVTGFGNQALNAAITATPTTFSGTVQINNFWAVNSMSSTQGNSTQVTVSFANNGQNILNNGTDKITLTDLFINTGDTRGNSAIVAFPPTGLNPTLAKTGNVSFVMDLSQATRSGIYTGVTITVEAKTL